MKQWPLKFDSLEQDTQTIVDPGGWKNKKSNKKQLILAKRGKFCLIDKRYTEVKNGMNLTSSNVTVLKKEENSSPIDGHLRDQLYALYTKNECNYSIIGNRILYY